MTDENEAAPVALTQEDAKKIEKVLDEVVNSMIRIKSEQEYINESLKELQDQYGIKKKVLRQAAKTRADDSYKEKEEEMETFETIYQTIFGDEGE